MEYKQANSDTELKQILELQKSNLRKVLSRQEMEKDGFVTVEHDLQLLKAMNERCGHIIALAENGMAGYALCMHPDFRHAIPVIASMFGRIDTHFPDQTTYMVMGQVCVAPAFRGKGVFRGLYDHMKSSLYPDYQEIVTEVDQRNSRSLQAHLAIGFRELETYFADGRNWHLIALSTRSTA